MTSKRRSVVNLLSVSYLSKSESKSILIKYLFIPFYCRADNGKR